jgi:hypothetical protein
MPMIGIVVEEASDFNHWGESGRLKCGRFQQEQKNVDLTIHVSRCPPA